MKRVRCIWGENKKAVLSQGDRARCGSTCRPNWDFHGGLRKSILKQSAMHVVIRCRGRWRCEKVKCGTVKCNFTLHFISFHVFYFILFLHTMLVAVRLSQCYQKMSQSVNAKMHRLENARLTSILFSFLAFSSPAFSVARTKAPYNKH